MAATTVASTSRAWNKTGTQDWWNAKSAFVVGTSLYVITQDTGASPKLRVHKSTSLSSLSFTEQDSANAPSVTSATHPFSAWATATHIHVVYFSAANTIVHLRFLLSSDTWTTGHGTVTTDAWNQSAIRVVVRSDDDVLVFFNSNADSADLKYARWEGASWTEVAIVTTTDGGTSAVLDATIDSANLSHVFYTDAAADDTSWISISSTNSASAQIDVDTTSTTSDASRCGGSFEQYSDAGTPKILIAYRDSDGTIDERIATLGAGAVDDNLGTQAQVEATTTTVGANTIIATAVLGTTPYVLWWDDANSGTFYFSTKSAGTWSARTSWKTQTGGDLTSATNMIAQLVSAGTRLFALYQDGTDVKIDLLAIATFERTVPASLVVSTVNERTVPASLVVSTTNERTVSASLAVSTANERTVPASLTVGIVHERTVPATLAISTTEQRTVPASVAVSTTGEQIVPASLAVSTVGERTVSASIIVATSNERTVPASLAVSESFERSVPATLVVATTQERVVPASVEVSTSAEYERTVPAALIVSTSELRSVPATLAVATQGERAVPASVAVSTTQERSVPASVAVATVEERTVSAGVAVSESLERTVPVSLAVSVVSERAVPVAVAIATTEERIVAASLVVSVVQIVGMRFSTHRRVTALGSQARPTFTTHRRPVIATRSDSREG